MYARKAIQTDKVLLAAQILCTFSFSLPVHAFLAFLFCDFCSFKSPRRRESTILYTKNLSSHDGKYDSSNMNEILGGLIKMSRNTIPCFKTDFVKAVIWSSFDNLVLSKPLFCLTSFKIAQITNLQHWSEELVGPKLLPVSEALVLL